MFYLEVCDMQENMVITRANLFYFACIEGEQEDKQMSTDIHTLTAHWFWYIFHECTAQCTKKKKETN